jgi:hypothetical protein
MNTSNWKIFDKAGSQLNWNPDPLIQLTFADPTGTGANGFLQTDPSGLAKYTGITNGGYSYTGDQTVVSYAYASNSDIIPLTPVDASVSTVVIPIFSTLNNFDTSTQSNIAYVKSIDGLVFDPCLYTRNFLEANDWSLFYPVWTLNSSCWSGDNNIGFTRDPSGSTVADTSTLTNNFTSEAHKTYKVFYNVSGLTQGDFNISFGGYTQSDVSTSGYFEIIATNNSPLIITPSIDLSVNNLYFSIQRKPTEFVYPSVTYASAIFLQPVATGLIETETLYILDEFVKDQYRRPYDGVNPILVMEFIGNDNQIQFFNVDENSNEITWTDSLAFDTSTFALDTPIQVNVGFRADAEGVYERILRIYHLVGTTLYTIAEIVVNAESIGEDERFRTLITNFGLPDPKGMKNIFKETDINEDLPDWKLLNYKSKHIILEYDKIMPFIGTYKGLINAIKWLGYDDIYIREWFLNVKTNTKLSLIVPYEAKDRTQTILMFSPEQRKTLKKLNQLSLNYCLTEETGTLDVYGTPETKDCYSYSLDEVFVKLLGLKTWLERNIIGVNCRITDITGEGIYFERVQNLVYTTDNIGFNYSIDQTLTPYSPDEMSELIMGDASIRLTFLELTNTKSADLPTTFGQMVSYAWNPSDPSTYYSITDPSYLANPTAFLLVGSSFAYPFINIADILWRLSVEKDLGGVLTNNVVTNPLFVYENEIRFYNTYDVSTVFFNVSTNLTVLLEKAYLRDPSIDEWIHSVAYSIYPDPSKFYDYIMESSIGDKVGFHDYAEFAPDISARLQYAYDTNYKVPLLSMQYFKFTDPSGNKQTFGNKIYYLDILDGKVYMNAGTVPNSSDNLTLYLNFNYDTSLSEQQITVNAVYESPRMRLFQFDPSAYYWADPSGRTGGNDPNVYLQDNSIYTIHVNHIGDYHIELFAWDEYNTLMYNPARELYPVFIKAPTLYTAIDNCCNNVCVSTYMSIDEVSTLISENPFPIYDRLIPLQGLDVEVDPSGNAYVSVPSITYFQDVPEPNSINRFINITERVTDISGLNITIDPDFQKFYSGDDVRLIRFDKGKYALIEEVSAHIISATPGQPTTATLNVIPPSFVIEASTDIYILNDTYRTVFNPSNNGSNFTADISNYQFEVNQIVGLIVSHNTNGYSWGSSYKVLDVSGTTHTFDFPVPEFFINNPSIYSIQAKHAFSTYADFTISTENADEAANNFQIYLKNSYCQEHYLDDTFVLINILFDQDKINQQWYEPSDNLINTQYFTYDQSKPLSVDISTLVILQAIYDPSNYLLNQQNIWEIIEHDSSIVLMKVFNKSVPYIFDTAGIYDVECTAYDSYGNAIIKKYEGLIQVS